jgi:KDO2-lipid IV(A) lauroyltransferase
VVAETLGKYLVLPFLRLFAWGFYLQPSSLRLFWGNALGKFLSLVRFRHKVISQNLHIAFPGDSADAVARRKALADEGYRHLGNLVFEILLLLGPMPYFIRKYGAVEGSEYWRAAKAKGKGVIFLSSHVGNWEVMSGIGTLLGGFDLMLVTKHLKPEWLHEAIEEGRRKCSVMGTYEPRTMRDVLSCLKKNGTVGFVLDQYTGPPVGVRVPVFGVPVGTSLALATLVKRTGATVIPVTNCRLPNGRFCIYLEPELKWQDMPDQEKTLELATNTAAYSQRVEQHIRAHPGQWLWTHRRFKGDLSPLRDGEWSEGRARN